MRKNRNNRPPEVGARGLLRLRCPCCGKEFGTYLHVSQMSIGCRCGATISLERGLAHYEFECGCCGMHAKGQTYTVPGLCKIGADHIICGLPVYLPTAKCDKIIEAPPQDGS